MNPDLLIARAIDALDYAAPEHALGLLKQALALDPDCARGHSVLALVLLVQNRLHAAQLEAQIGLTLEPESSLSHLAVGQVAFAQRRFSAAVSALEQACALAPDDAEPRRVLAQTQWTLGQRGAAEANAQQALALAPDDAGVHATIAQFRSDQGKLDEAEAAARTALSLDPEHAGAVLVMGYLMLNRGELEAAREHAVLVLQNDPTDQRALHLMVALKAKTSLFLGLWWRYNTWMSSKGSRAMVLLLLGYFMYRLLLIYTKQHQLAFAEDVTTTAWLAFCAYTWVAPAMFQKAVNKELSEVQLKEGF